VGEWRNKVNRHPLFALALTVSTPSHSSAAVELHCRWRGGGQRGRAAGAVVPRAGAGHVRRHAGRLRLRQAPLRQGAAGAGDPRLHCRAWRRRQLPAHHSESHAAWGNSAAFAGSQCVSLHSKRVSPSSQHITASPTRPGETVPPSQAPSVSPCTASASVPAPNRLSSRAKKSIAQRMYPRSSPA
jgi:hypothetical protein